MMSARQAGGLFGWAILLWAVAAAWIRFAPSAITDATQGDLGFLFGIPVCWLCIALVRRTTRLSPDQLVPGTALVVGSATLTDASILRWAPALYGRDEHVLHLGAAWLLWGYGVTLLLALLMAHRAAGGAPVSSRAR